MKKVLLILACFWLALCFWAVVKPREDASSPTLPWLEVNPTLSEDGRWLAFERDPQAKAVFGRNPKAKTEIVLLDRETDKVQVVRDPQMAYLSPQLTADGSRMALEGAPGPDFLSDIYIADTETLTLRKVQPPRREGGHGTCFAPRISASGEVLSFVTYRPLSEWYWERTVALGSPEKMETPFPKRVSETSGAIALSPDGRRVVWENDAIDADEIYKRRLMSADGKSSPVSLDAPAWEPTLSNELCAYVKADNDGVYQIMLYDFEKGQTRQLTRGNDDSLEPCLSADGKSLVFTSYATDLTEGEKSGHSHIYLLELETSQFRLITPNGDGNSYNPTLSGDGSTVAFASLATNLGEEKVEPGQVYLWERGWKQCRPVKAFPE